MRAFLVVLLLVVGPAHAQERLARILDLPFDAPMDRAFPYCYDVAGQARDDYCSETGPYAPTLPHKVINLRPPNETGRPIPTWAHAVRVKLDQQFGVAEINITTGGPSEQRRVLRSLQDRFGEPSTFAPTEATTRAGVKFEVIKAEWELPSAHVYHNCFRIDRCVVLIQTAAEHQRMLDEDAKRERRDKL